MKEVEAYEIFGRFYDEFIKKNVPSLHDKYADFLVEIIGKNNIKGKKLYDASCGTGILLNKLRKYGFEVEGSDLSDSMLIRAREKGLNVKKIDMKNLSSEEKFDVVFSFDTMGHFHNKNDFYEGIKGMKSICKKGGLIVFDGGTREKANKMTCAVYTYDSSDYSFVWENKSLAHGRVEVALEIKDKIKNEKYLEKFNLCGHDLYEVKEVLNELNLEIIEVTLEERVKKGSFMSIAKRGEDE